MKKPINGNDISIWPEEEENKQKIINRNDEERKWNSNDMIILCDGINVNDSEEKYHYYQYLMVI